MEERRYDIDWLRVLVMLAVFFFHSDRFFGGGTWHLNNETESTVAWVFIGWLDMWFMPLFCLLSGVGSWYGFYLVCDQRKNRQQRPPHPRKKLLPDRQEMRSNW